MRRRAGIICLMLAVAVIFGGCTPLNAKAQKSALAHQSAASATVAPFQDFGSVTLVLISSTGKGTDTDAVIKYIQQRSGVLIKPVWSENTFTQFTLMVASGMDVDATVLAEQTCYTFTNNGTIMPIDSYLDQYGPDLLRVINPKLWNWCKKDGSIYGIPSESIDIPKTIQIRKDWLDALGLQIPATVDQFVSVMKEFKAAYQTNPLLIISGYDNCIDGFFLPMGYSWWDSGNGTYLPPEMHPDYVKLLATLNSWYEEGIIHPESFSGDHDQLIDDNKIGANIGWYSSVFNACKNLIKQVPSAEYVFLQPLAGKYNRGYKQSASISGIWAISANSKNPRGVITLLNWYVADIENTIIGRAGIPGVHWEYIDKSQNLVKITQDGTKYASPFELLDVNGMAEKEDVSSNPSDARLKWYYDYWNIDYGNKVKATYTSLDDRFYISDILLDKDAQDVLNDADSTLQQAKVAFITGARNLSQWDDFIKEWRAAGEDKIIASKNMLYKQYVK